MLLQNEIKVGEFYAWDINVTEPDNGCNLFTILENHNNLLSVGSIDGCTIQTCGSHCLIPADRALARFDVLKGMEIPEDSHAQWKYNREFNHLESFKCAYEIYLKKINSKEFTEQIKTLVAS